MPNGAAWSGSPRELPLAHELDLVVAGARPVESAVSQGCAASPEDHVLEVADRLRPRVRVQRVLTGSTLGAAVGVAVVGADGAGADGAGLLQAVSARTGECGWEAAVPDFTAADMTGHCAGLREESGGRHLSDRPVSRAAADGHGELTAGGHT